jgi:hypothetical protein
VGSVDKVSQGVVRRRINRAVGVFIDGVGLDRASRRLGKRVDLTALLRGVTSGTAPVVARYYTVIPYEDDSRHRAFLDAVARAGTDVIVKRLPPKGVTRQVTTDVEMGVDIIAFAKGHTRFGAVDRYLPAELQASFKPPPAIERPEGTEAVEQYSIVVVCPTRELSYPLGLARDLGADTTCADFSASGDVLKSASKWIDLSTSETIWMD